MATHSVSAAQVGIPCVLTLCGFFPFIVVTHNVGIRSPHIWTSPICRPSIIPVIGFLELSRDWFITVKGGTVLNLLFSQINVNEFPFFIDVDQRIRRDQYLLSHKPVSCVSDQVANHPVLIIEVEFFDLPYFPVETIQFVT